MSMQVKVIHKYHRQTTTNGNKRRNKRYTTFSNLTLSQPQTKHTVNVLIPFVERDRIEEEGNDAPAFAYFLFVNNGPMHFAKSDSKCASSKFSARNYLIARAFPSNMLLLFDCRHSTENAPRSIT